MDPGRSDRGHVSRQDRRGRDRRAGHLPSEASVHPGPHLGRPESRSEASREAHDPEGERPDAVNIPNGCRFHPRCPLAFEKCGWSAAEIAEELTALWAGGLLPGFAGIQPLDPATVSLGMAPGTSPGTAAATLRRVVSENRSSRLALKGIAAVRETAGAVHVTPHGSSEPPLIEIGPGNTVACHLVTPQTMAAEPVTA